MSHYKMHRGWMDNPVFAKEPYSEAQAFEWMVSKARWKEGVEPINGNPVVLKRGQFSASVRFMSDIFKWTTDHTRWFIKKLEKFKMCTTANTTGQLVISICNYSKYQSIDGGEPQAEPQANTEGTPSEHHKLEEGKEGKEGKEKKRRSKKPPIDFTLPDWIPEHTWAAFNNHRQQLRKPMSGDAMALTVKELDKLRARGFAPEDVLNQSIQRGWTGIFEIKGDKNDARTGNHKSAVDAMFAGFIAAVDNNAV